MAPVTQRAVPFRTPEEDIERQSNILIESFVNDRFDRDREFGGAESPISEASEVESATESDVVLERSLSSFSLAESDSSSDISSSSRSALIYSCNNDKDDEALWGLFSSLADSIEQTHGAKIRSFVVDINNNSFKTGRSPRQVFHESTESLLSGGVTGGKMMTVILSGYELFR